MLDDWVIEVDNKSITHRPDLWGHYGIARELRR
jgi:phenylalanyl-tRNA synthetase beta chain